MCFVENFARFFRTAILHLIIAYYAKEGVLKNSAKFMTKLLVRIDLVWPAANLLMLCRIDCKSVFVVLSLSIEMQSSNDLALMST